MLRSTAFAVAFLLAYPSSAFADSAVRVAPETWWRAWNVDSLVLLSIGVMVWLYVRGLYRIWKKAGVGHKIRGWQAYSFFAALVVILLALLSPVDALAWELSSLHMVQHMLLTSLAAPLFILGSPAFVLAWGLRARNRGTGSELFRLVFRIPHEAILWQPLVVGPLFAGVLWAWHHPLLYQSALRDPLLHDAQHLSFFITACLFWRVCLDPLSPRRMSPAVAVPYLFAISLPISALGIFLSLSPRVWYDEYAGRTAAWGLTSLEDQQLAGLIMWMPSCLIYPAVGIVLFGLWLAQPIRAERKAQRRHAPTIPLRNRAADNLPYRRVNYGGASMSQKRMLAAIAALFLGIVAHRVWVFVPAPPEMPAELVESEERNLYLSAGGKYSTADILANGPAVPSEKYRDFQANHDFNPGPGDWLCPITRTKANADCTWTIGGHRYQFCCPPCIDEFVRLAKQQPDKILPPKEYVK